MKRFHIHITVSDLENSLEFYSAMFGVPPSKQKDDYAKWMLDDPRINFAISTRGAKVGLDHLGLQVDSSEELQKLRTNMSAAKLSLFNEGEATCCYATSEKSWLEDPSGIPWEAYVTMEDVDLFSMKKSDSETTCCTADAECC